jgi:hypothetical protein
VKRRTLPALGSLASLTLVSALASAQDPAAKASAVQLFDEADRLMQQGNVSAACHKFAASMKLDPQLGALLHLAGCYAKNGQLASAWGAYREAEEMGRMKGDERAALAKEQAALIEPRLSRLQVVVPDNAHVQGLEVRVDGSPLMPGAWGNTAPIDPGSHGVEARAPGYEAWSSSVDVTGDAQSVRVEIPVLTPSAPAAPGNAATPVTVQVDDTGSPIRTLGWVGLGVGAASLGLGAVFLVQKNSKLDQRDGICPTLLDCTEQEDSDIKSLTSDARTADTLATAGFIVGGTLVVGGVAAIIFAPKAKARANAAWLLPAVTPRGVGLAGGLTW